MQIYNKLMWYQGLHPAIITESEESIHIKIEPEKNQAAQLYFMISENNFKKKYTIEIHFYHEHASIELYGLYQLRDQQILDIQTRVYHHVPLCSSKQLWKGVLHDQSKAVFEGNILVDQKAQKTTAQLSNKNLLLSRDAMIKTKPFLEIYADDVKCSHGATVGCLDESALFYLRSRGIDQDAAKQILVNAFINELVEFLPEQVRDELAA